MLVSDDLVPATRIVERHPGRRSRDQRRGFASLLASLAVGNREHDARPLRHVFEDAVRRLVPVRDARLRDTAAPFGPAMLTSTSGSGMACFDVPLGAGRLAALEVAFDRSCGLDDWDVQALAAASHVATLVLELEHARARARSSGILSRPRRDEEAVLIGSSPRMCALRDRIDRVAATDFTILIEGESGSGKELVARRVHAASRRSPGPFVAVNCAALVETLVEAELFGIEERTATGVRGRRGKFEHADGGTLFLDEVADLAPAAQAKLLRAIQDLSIERVGGQGSRRVDIRIVAATNRSLAEMVMNRQFRPDLFYRLSGVELYVPPLRTRREDIPELVRHFLDRHRRTRRLELSPAAADALLAYEWPGNVRELERAIEGIVALGRSDRIELEDLPSTVRGDARDALVESLARGDSMRAWGSRYAQLVVDRCAGNKRQACRVLNISYHTLQGYLRYRGDEDAAEPAAEPEREEVQIDPVIPLPQPEPSLAPDDRMAPAAVASEHASEAQRVGAVSQRRGWGPGAVNDVGPHAH